MLLRRRLRLVADRTPAGTADWASSRFERDPTEPDSALSMVVHRPSDAAVAVAVPEVGAVVVGVPSAAAVAAEEAEAAARAGAGCVAGVGAAGRADFRCARTTMVEAVVGNLQRVAVATVEEIGDVDLVVAAALAYAAGASIVPVVPSTVIEIVVGLPALVAVPTGLSDYDVTAALASAAEAVAASSHLVAVGPVGERTAVGAAGSVAFAVPSAAAESAIENGGGVAVAAVATAAAAVAVQVQDGASSKYRV